MMSQMRSSAEVKASLNVEEWQEGRVIYVAVGSYRHRTVIHCTESGRQSAVFADGKEHKFAGYMEIMNGKGEWIRQGAGMVPVLPDGRMLMVVEQRPPQGRFENRPTIAMIGGEKVDLAKFGPHSSLEFPGGAVEPGQGLKAAYLAELVDETGVGEQSAMWYSRTPPVYPFGSDLALQQFLSVVYLSGLKFEPYVADDGGLQVFALTEKEVQENIWGGVICSGQAALLQWAFYQEVKKARVDEVFAQKLFVANYMKASQVQIIKSK